MVECAVAGETRVCDRDSRGVSQHQIAQNVSNDHKNGGRIVSRRVWFESGVESRNEFVKQAMLQTLGHLIAIVPEHFHVSLFPC